MIIEAQSEWPHAVAVTSAVAMAAIRDLMEEEVSLRLIYAADASESLIVNGYLEAFESTGPDANGDAELTLEISCPTAAAHTRVGWDIEVGGSEGAGFFLAPQCVRIKDGDEEMTLIHRP